MTNTKPKILIVDDTRINIKVLIRILKHDYTLFSTTNGNNAFDIVLNQKPDLILLDIMMPDIDGYDVCKQLKADARTAMVPVIFLTAMTDHDSETKGLEMGAIDYITKPINPAILEIRVKNHLLLQQEMSERRRAEEQLEIFNKDLNIQLKERTKELYESEERFQLAITGMGDGIWDWMVDTGDIYFSPQWKKMLGFEDDEIENKFTALQRLIHADDLGKMLVAWSDYMDGTVANYQLEYRMLTKQGHYIWVQSRGVGALDETGRPYRMAGSHTDISERKHWEQTIRDSLEEKSVLLREVYHRVKNNMQVIASMLKLQARCIPDKIYANIFNNCERRIQSMALIHEKLYRSKELNCIDLAGYVKTLAHDLFESNGISSRQIQLHIEGKDIPINLDAAIPCGLIVNELITNTLKYAFPEGRQGEIHISMIAEGEFGLMLRIQDNGIGFPDDFDMANAKSLGLRLVHSFNRQLRGELNITNENGTCFDFHFKDVRK